MNPKLIMYTKKKKRNPCYWHVLMFIHKSYEFSCKIKYQQTKHWWGFVFLQRYQNRIEKGEETTERNNRLKLIFQWARAYRSCLSCFVTWLIGGNVSVVDVPHKTKTLHVAMVIAQASLVLNRNAVVVLTKERMLNAAYWFHSGLCVYVSSVRFDGRFSIRTNLIEFMLVRKTHLPYRDCEMWRKRATSDCTENTDTYLKWW